MWASLVGAVIQGLILFLTTQLGSIFLKFGLGFATFAVYKTLFDSAVSYIQSAYVSPSGELSSVAFQMIQLCGLPDGINVILSAYSVRALILSMTLHLLKRA